MAMAHAPGFLALVHEAKARVRSCSIEDFVARLETGAQFVLIDVREDHEWDRGHIPGAHHIGRGILERDIEKTLPEKATPIVLYCGGGFRSALAADNLQRMGYTDVTSLDGGWSGWVERGLPTATPGENA